MTVVVVRSTFHYMMQPTSLRLPEPVKDRLDRRAASGHEKPSSLAVRLIDEGLRMDEHPGVAFHHSAVHGRVACLARGPDIAEIIDVLVNLEAQGDARVAETAEWFGIHPSSVRIALGYYAAFRDEIDSHMDLRHRVAAEARGRYEVEQSLLK